MRQTAILAGLCLWGAAAFAADPALLNLVMPNAKVLAGVNVTKAKTSPLGQFVLARIAASGKPLPAFFTAAGFDPRTDVNELLFASAADPSSPGGLALASGMFNVTEIAMSAAGHKDVAVQTYDNDTIILTTNPKAKVVHAVAFLNNGSIAVAGDEADVKAALDRSTTQNAIDSALAAQVNTLSTNNDAWIASLVGPPGQKLQAVKAIQSFGGGVMLGSDVIANGEAIANSAENAKALGDVVQLLITAGSKRSTDSLILQNLKVSVNGSTITLTLTLTESQAETVIASVLKPANDPAERQQGAPASGRARPRVR